MIRLRVPTLAVLALPACLGACLGASLVACPAARADDLAGTCAELIQEKATIRAGEPSLLKTLFKLIFDHSSFVNPDVVDSADSSDSGDSTTALPQTSGQAGVKIRVFTLGHPEPVSKEDKKLLKELSAAEKRQLQAVNHLLKSKTAAECASEAGKIGWSPDQLSALETLENSALQATRHEESQLSMKEARKAVSRYAKSALSFEIVPVDSWGEIVQSLRQDPVSGRNPVSGMILIAHADENGRLYDSLRDELPTGFFRGLPPSVRFIGIFSCEGAEVAQSYQLAGADPSNPRSAGREIVTVGLEAPFNAAQTAPLQFFPDWLKKLAPLFPQSFSPDSSAAAEAECPLVLNGLELREGRLAVTIRGLPAGVWESSSESESQLVPCSWLSDSSSLSVFAEPSQLGETVVMSPDPLSAGFTDGASVFSLDHEQVFTESGAFRSLILTAAPSPSPTPSPSGSGT